MNENELEDTKKFIPPKTIVIEDKTYKYKDELINQNYIYRCQKRKKCGLLIKISKKEIINYLKDKNYTIKYETTGKLKEHQCLENEPIENENAEEPIIKYDKEKIKILIINSLGKPLSFHIMNLKNNDIILKKKHIKYLLKKYRENNFPSDSKFLNDKA